MHVFPDGSREIGAMLKELPMGAAKAGATEAAPKYR
jgi:hypothetical protein